MGYPHQAGAPQKHQTWSPTPPLPPVGGPRNAGLGPRWPGEGSLRTGLEEAAITPCPSLASPGLAVPHEMRVWRVNSEILSSSAPTVKEE